MKNKNVMLVFILSVLMLSFTSPIASADDIYEGTDPSKIPRELQMYFYVPEGFSIIKKISVYDFKNSPEDKYRLEYMIVTSPYFVKLISSPELLSTVQDEIWVTCDIYNMQKPADERFSLVVNDMMEHFNESVRRAQGEEGMNYRKFEAGPNLRGYLEILTYGGDGRVAVVQDQYILLAKNATVEVRSNDHKNVSSERTYAMDLATALSKKLLPPGTDEALLDVFVHNASGKPEYKAKIIVLYGPEMKSSVELVTDYDGKASKKFLVGKDINNNGDVLVKYVDPNGTYLSFTKGKIKLPARVDITVTNIKEHVDALKFRVIEFLKKAGFSEAEYLHVLNGLSNVDYTASSFKYDVGNKRILADIRNVQNAKDLAEFDRNLLHEVGHLISDTAIDPTGIIFGKSAGGGHATPWGVPDDKSEVTAFEESIAHFFTQVMYRRVTGLSEDYDKDFESSELSKQAADGWKSPGNLIEGNMAAFLSAYYKKSMGKPEAVFKDFKSTLLQYQQYGLVYSRPVRTIEEFLEVKLDNNMPGMRYSGNVADMAEEYRIKSSKVWNTVMSSREKKETKIQLVFPDQSSAPVPEDKPIFTKLLPGAVIQISKEMPAMLKRYPENFLTTGKAQWVYSGPKNTTIIIEKGDIPHLVEGSAQFENTPAMAPDGQTIITPTKTNFAMEVDENKNVRVTTISGEVAIENRKTQEKGIVSENRFITIKPGVPLETSQPVSGSDMRAWWIKPARAAVAGQPQAVMLASAKALPDKPARSALPRADTITLKNGQYRIWLPPGWKVNENPPDAELNMKPADENSFVKIGKAVLEKNLNLQLFVGVWETTSVGPGKPYFEKVTGRTVRVSGKEGYQGEYRSKYGGVNIYGTITFFIDNNNIYVVTCVAVESDKDKMRGTFDKVIESLRITTTGPQSQNSYLENVFDGRNMAGGS